MKSHLRSRSKNKLPNLISIDPLFLSSFNKIVIFRHTKVRNVRSIPYSQSTCGPRFWRVRSEVVIRFVKPRKIDRSHVKWDESTTGTAGAGRAKGRIPLGSYVCRETAATTDHLLQLRLLRACHPLRAAAALTFISVVTLRK